MSSCGQGQPVKSELKPVSENATYDAYLFCYSNAAENCHVLFPWKKIIEVFTIVSMD